MNQIVVSRVSSDQVQVDLPFAHGMRFTLSAARELRERLDAALRSHQEFASMVAEAVTVGQAAVQRRGSSFAGKIHAIKHLRDLSACSLYDAKTAIDATGAFETTKQA